MSNYIQVKYQPLQKNTHIEQLHNSILVYMGS